MVIRESIESAAAFRGKKRKAGTSLAVHWLRLCLPMQGPWVQSLVRELRCLLDKKKKTKKKNRKAVPTIIIYVISPVPSLHAK